MDKLDLILQEIRILKSKFDEKFEQIDKKFEQIDRKFEQIDKRFEQIDKRFEQIDKRFEQIDKRFEQIDKRFEQIDKKFEQIDKKFEQIDKRFEQIDKKFEQIDKRFDAIDTRITILVANNLEEHNKIYSLLNSLNNSFLKFEAEINDKIKILFDGYSDLQDHKNIVNHQITSLNSKVSNHSFRISKLENS